MTASDGSPLALTHTACATRSRPRRSTKASPTSVALALRYQLISNGDVDGWLLPGRKPGTHITAEHLRKRLAPSGVTSRSGRHGALLALAGRLPAPILAERLGIHQARAAQWVRAVGATYSGHVELRLARDVGDVP